MTCQFQRWKGCKMGEALSCKYLSGCFHLKAREAQVHVWCVCSVAQSCLMLCDLMDCSPPGSSVYEILQASLLEWVAISSSKKSSQPKDWTGVSCISCICKRILCHWATIGSPTLTNLSVKEDSIGSQKFRGIRLQAEWTQRFKEVIFSSLALSLPWCGAGFLLRVTETTPGLSRLMDAQDLHVKGSVLV